MSVVITGGRRDTSFARALDALITGRFASRLFALDHTLWGQAAEAEATIRLGWTDFSASAIDVIAQAERLRADFADRGIDRIVLCGMGGSSLAPQVISDSLTVLDSTHPDAVSAILAQDLHRTAVVVSSKSGGTLETLSHKATYEAAFERAGIDSADRIVVVTDPGSSLEGSAKAAGQRVFHADPHVGGRFSALTAFGLVPSILSGVPVAHLVDEAGELRESLMRDDAANPALVLAACIAAGLPERFALEIHSSDTALAGLGLWIEQLIAESTGKNGKGVYPIAISDRVGGSAEGSPSVQRVNVQQAHATETSSEETSITVSGPLGAQFLLWETATAALGFLLQIDPFNQPDVEAAKAAARELFAAENANTRSEELPLPREVAAALRREATADAYLAVQSFVSPLDTEVGSLLDELHTVLMMELGVPVSLGLGPRYLHSTGQFHKGGRAVGIFLQLVDLPESDFEIPGNDLTFGAMLTAQAAGDASVLRERGRPVLTVRTHEMPGFIRQLITELAD